MKIIFSRKGIDSGFAELPSPIMPDKKMLSIPIPDTESDYTYSDLKYNESTYLQIIEELKGWSEDNIEKKFKTLKCHIDPDLENRYIQSPENWKPAFGQKGASAEHLKNSEHKVEVGDIFLFFGWFRETEYADNSKLQFVKSAPDIHAIYGYMQVGEIIDNDKIETDYSYHPHARPEYIKDSTNTLYIPSEKLSIIKDKDVPGYKMLNYSKKRRLTAIDVRSRGIWDLPECFRNVDITYHNKINTGFINDKDKYFYSAARGQEFICMCDDNKEILDWVKTILTD